MKILLFMMCSFFLITSSQGQVRKPTDASKEFDRSIFGMGLSAGVASGFGLSFRQHLPGEVSYQIVGGIIKADRKLYYNFGTELQYDLARGESTRFFAAGALGYFYSGENGSNDLSGPARLGAGIGIESAGMQSLSLSLELLFTYFSDGSVLPLPQLAAHYYFF